MKVSIIVTERNEVNAIAEFIDSALSQSMKPDEIVIADAGSTDGTVEVIKQYIAKGAPIKLVNAPGNRSVGRNAATRAAKNEVIAVTDVGCELDPTWLEEITKPFIKNKDLQVVSGYFKPRPKTKFEDISSYLMTSELDEIDINEWLPSSRSIAYKKAAWRKVGEYPEYAEYGNSYIAKMCGGEDTLYDIKLRKAGYEFGDGLKAVVYWRPRTNLVEFYKQYWMYTVGDGIRLVDAKHHVRRVVEYTIFLLLFIVTGLFNVYAPVIILGLFLVRQYKKVLPKYIKRPGVKNLCWMLLLMTTYDVATIFGFARGYIARLSLPASTRKGLEE